MSVYFIACGGFIKVGFSDNPERRVKNLFQSGSRYTAPRAAFEARAERTLLRSIEGDKDTERTIHRALEDFYAGCEWFVDEPQLRDWIAAAMPDDRLRKRDYPKLVRLGGRVEVPQGDMGGGNYDLNIAVWLKGREQATASPT